MSEYETRVSSLTVLPKGGPIYSESATTVRIECEAGEYVVVEQHMPGYGKVGINPDEWPVLRAAIDEMIGRCASDVGVDK